MPALLTRTSSEPTCSVARAICIALVTSSVSGVTRGSAISRPPRTPAYTRSAPRRSASLTSARPMPRLAPVIKTVLFAMFIPSPVVSGWLQMPPTCVEPGWRLKLIGFAAHACEFRGPGGGHPGEPQQQGKERPTGHHQLDRKIRAERATRCEQSVCERLHGIPPLAPCGSQSRSHESHWPGEGTSYVR